MPNPNPNPKPNPKPNPNPNPNLASRALTIALGTRAARFVGPPAFHLPWLLLGRAPFWACGRFGRRSWGQFIFGEISYTILSIARTKIWKVKKMFREADSVLNDP